MMDNNFELKVFEDDYSYKEKLEKDLQLNIPSLSAEDRLDMLKSVQTYNLCNYVISDKYHLSEDEINYIKKYLLKYDTTYAIQLYKIYPEKFDDNEKDYLLACCLENNNLCHIRLKNEIESDYDNGENCIMRKLVDSLFEKSINIRNLIHLFYETNMDLQKYIFSKIMANEKTIELIEQYENSFDRSSIIYKYFFYKNILNKNYVHKLIKFERFFDLDDNEKQVFHDLYYEQIYKEYIKSSKNKLLKYLKNYQEYLFESEMIDNIKKAYLGKGNLDQTDFEHNCLYTEKMYNIYESYQVANHIEKLNTI